VRIRIRFGGSFGVTHARRGGGITSRRTSRERPSSAGCITNYGIARPLAGPADYLF
jgi:hypothetical protein